MGRGTSANSDYGTHRHRCGPHDHGDMTAVYLPDDRPEGKGPFRRLLVLRRAACGAGRGQVLAVVVLVGVALADDLKARRHRSDLSGESSKARQVAV